MEGDPTVGGGAATTILGVFRVAGTATRKRPYARCDASLLIEDNGESVVVVVVAVVLVKVVVPMVSAEVKLANEEDECHGEARRLKSLSESEEALSPDGDSAVVVVIVVVVVVVEAAAGAAIVVEMVVVDASATTIAAATAASCLASSATRLNEPRVAVEGTKLLVRRRMFSLMAWRLAAATSALVRWRSLACARSEVAPGRCGGDEADEEPEVEAEAEDDEAMELCESLWSLSLESSMDGSEKARRRGTKLEMDERFWARRGFMWSAADSSLNSRPLKAATRPGKARRAEMAGGAFDVVAVESEYCREGVWSGERVVAKRLRSLRGALAEPRDIEMGQVGWLPPVAVPKPVPIPVPMVEGEVVSAELEATADRSDSSDGGPKSEAGCPFLVDRDDEEQEVKEEVDKKDDDKVAAEPKVEVEEKEG